MPEPVSLTLGVVVAALVVKAAEKAGETAVEAGAGVLGRIVTAVRSRFSKANDSDGEKALDVAEAAPDSAKALERLAAKIDAHAADDSKWAQTLQTLVDEAKAGDEVDVDQTVQTIYGDHNIAVQRVEGSTISINQPPSTGS